jgi:hypothetical protein
MRAAPTAPAEGDALASLPVAQGNSPAASPQFGEAISFTGFRP